MNTADVAPAFQASRFGYAVWLGNSRGNKYSRAHKQMNPDWDTTFWMFGWEEMGTYDVPANLEYIIKSTGHSKVAYIAHSQGTTQMFYALAENEAYFVDKVSIFVALGPVTKLTHCKSGLINVVADFSDVIEPICQDLGIYEFFPADWLTKGLFRTICGYIPDLCKLGIFLIADEDTDLDKDERTQDYLGHFPSGTSLRCLLHYAQIMNNDKFRRFDYDYDTNKKIYGQHTPPEIPLNKISKVPIALFVGSRDELATSEDNAWNYEQMQKAVVYYKEWTLGHMAFMVAKDMSYFYEVGKLLNKYHPL